MLSSEGSVSTTAMNHDRIERSMMSLLPCYQRRGRESRRPTSRRSPLIWMLRMKAAVVQLVLITAFPCFFWAITANGFLFSSSNHPTRQRFVSSPLALIPIGGESDGRTGQHHKAETIVPTQPAATNHSPPHISAAGLGAPISTNAPLDRRAMAVETSRWATMPAVSAMLPFPSHAAEAFSNDDFVDLPLDYVPTLGAYVVRYVLFGEPFSAIVDTGSPFLTVPCYCKPYRNQKMFWGCYKPELTFDSGYGNTIEGFDNNYGTVVWRKAGFSFSESEIAGEEVPSTTDVVFGVLDRDLLNGSGGVFFGLIKETDRWIRPSFLGQMGYKSFCVDLRHSGDGKDATTVGDDNRLKSPRLVLSKQSMIGTGNWRGTNDSGGRIEADREIELCVPLVRDLRNKYGAPVVHYTAKASKFVVNGLPLLISRNKPLYVIFDTGVSGMVVSQELFDGRYLQARKNREKSLWGTVAVSFRTDAGEEVTLRANKPITTPLGKATPWKGFRGNLIAVGLAFLDGLATTVDVDDGKILFTET